MAEPQAAPRPAACGECGRLAEAGVPWTWTRELEGGREVLRCERCTLAHTRDIEARLDEAWWE